MNSRLKFEKQVKVSASEFKLILDIAQQSNEPFYSENSSGYPLLTYRGVRFIGVTHGLLGLGLERMTYDDIGNRLSINMHIDEVFALVSFIDEIKAFREAS